MNDLFKSKLSHLAVLGAGGKMGRGISLILLKLILKAELHNEPTLLLIDTHPQSFAPLKDYLYLQLQKCLQKEETWTKHLGHNSEDQHAVLMQRVNNILFFSDKVEALKGRELIFEAVPEWPKLKIDLLKQVSKVTSKEATIFSNTSSIPIAYLEEQTQLKGRLIGFHFYNPPPVQNLLELIYSEHTPEKVKDLATDTLKQMNKTPIQSNDIAGFIGNGHFIREGLRAFHHIGHALQHEERCREIMTLNYVSEKGLLRPMGIFQLIDYVGLDVFKSIANVLKEHLPNDHFDSSLLDAFLQANRKGGQTVEGDQKEGIFLYDGRRITGIYDPLAQKAFPWHEKEHQKMLSNLGIERDPSCRWKDLHPEKSIPEIQAHYRDLFQESHLFSTMTHDLLQESYSIAMQLLQDGVAKSGEDINQVLIKGFHHRYSPLNSFLPIHTSKVG